MPVSRKKTGKSQVCRKHQKFENSWPTYSRLSDKEEYNTWSFVHKY